MLSKRYKNDSKPLLRLNNVQVTAKKEVEKKILEGTYKFEAISCPICNTTETELLSEKDRYGIDYQVKVCCNCGLVYTNPRMTQKSYNEFYDMEYRRLYVGTEMPTNSFFERQYKKGKLIYDFIKSTFPDKKISDLKVLEVGCGAGGILYYFQQQGCKTLGLDLGKEYLEYGIDKYGLDLRQGSLEDSLDFIPDIVIYSHVMEHILDLKSELLKLKEISHKNTIFYIEVPGIKNIHNNYKMDTLFYLQNAHTFHFTLTSLTNLFEKYGYKLIRGTEYVRSIFSISEVVNKENKFINEYPEIVKYLKKMEQTRHLYLFKIANLKYFVKVSIISLIKSIRLYDPLKKLIDKDLPTKV